MELNLAILMVSMKTDGTVLSMFKSPQRHRDFHMHADAE